MRTITVEDYNPQWPIEFEELKTIYLQHLQHLNVEVQHVGSTSVPELASKPILDIDIIIDNADKLPEVIAILKDLGYTHQGDLGIPEREAFKRESERVPYHENKQYRFDHHLYVCLAGSLSLENHLRFRDYLRNHPEAIEEYGNLKKALAREHPHDIDAYIAGKTEFITGVLGRVGLGENDIDKIAMQNIALE